MDTFRTQHFALCREVVLFERLLCIEILEYFWFVLCSEVCPLSECLVSEVPQILILHTLTALILLSGPGYAGNCSMHFHLLCQKIHNRANYIQQAFNGCTVLSLLTNFARRSGMPIPAKWCMRWSLAGVPIDVISFSQRVRRVQEFPA